MYLCIRTCIFAEQSIYKGTFAVGVSFFGQRVKVLFDDKKEYMGVIAMWYIGICKQMNGSQNLKMGLKTSYRSCS